MSENIEVKTCTKCLHTLPLDDFPVTTCRGRRLVRSWCRDCLKEYHRKHDEERRRKKQAVHNTELDKAEETFTKLVTNAQRK